MFFDPDWQLQFIIIGQVIYAMLLGGLIGYERELAHKPAGLRTHILVAGASALFMALSISAANYYHTVLGSSPGVQADLLRIAAAIVTGISFLGAGTIFKAMDEKNKIGGLTTAASIWFAAAVGMTSAVGQLLTAAVVTIIALIVLRVRWH
jgi:putative Mg2+ transporter-C (MgtC) family protein